MKKFSLIGMFAIFFTTSALATCKSDMSLKAAGFNVQTRNFKKIMLEKEEWFLKNNHLFELDTKGTIYSSVVSQMVTVTSHDNIETPRETMFGDVVFFELFSDKQMIEIRWFENGKKHVAYDPKVQPCATNTIPVAVNSLF